MNEDNLIPFDQHVVSTTTDTDLIEQLRHDVYEQSANLLVRLDVLARQHLHMRRLLCQMQNGADQDQAQHDEWMVDLQHVARQIELQERSQWD